MASSSSVLTETHRLASPGRVITELTRGREIADRLRLILRETTGSPDSVFPAQSLVTQLLDTFTHSLTMLRDADEVSQAPSAAAVKSEDSGDSCKTPPPAKDRRGCYKRKRNAETVIKESPNMVEDGHAWRKYGQKVILNAKHPRNYFRCTHKYEQGCQATKQVQRVQDNPPLYRSTYTGHHTCNANANNIIISSNDTSSPPHSSSQVIWTFDTAAAAATTTTISPVKQEIHNNNNNNNNNYSNKKVEIKSSSSSSSQSQGNDDYYIAVLDHHHHHLNLGDISSDVYSCSASATTHDDRIDDSISIEDFFEF